MYTDTDSLIYEIKDQCPYALMKDNIDFFDTFDHPSEKSVQQVVKEQKSHRSHERRVQRYDYHGIRRSA